MTISRIFKMFGAGSGSRISAISPYSLSFKESWDRHCEISRSPVESCSWYPDSGQTPPGLQLKVRGPCDLGILWLVPTHTVRTNSVFIGDSWSVIPTILHTDILQTNIWRIWIWLLICNWIVKQNQIYQNQSINHSMVVAEMEDILWNGKTMIRIDFIQ